MGQFFNSNVLEKLETSWVALVKGYWMSMTRFRHIKTGVEILFFNSHWKHGYGMEQAEIVANFIHEQRTNYNSEPALLVGDTNQFCKGHDSEAWKYLLGTSSPEQFEDVIEHDKEKSFSVSNNPDCRVDLIFASKGDWIVRQSDIDRDGMGSSGTASDHAPLMAELLFDD